MKRNKRMRNWPPIIVPDGFSYLVNFRNPIQQMVLPIVARTKDQIIPIGSGFIVSPQGLMITAAHILDDFEEFAQSQKQEAYEVFALYFDHASDLEMMLWPIEHIWIPEGFDTAFLHLRALDISGHRYQFPLGLPLCGELPKEGEKVLAIGYHASKATTAAGPSGKKIVNYYQEASFSSGNVIEVYAERGAGNMQFPFFHTDARYDGQMSGGPIMNEKGGVVGVVCSGMPPGPDFEGHSSFGALLWPLLGSELEIGDVTESIKTLIDKNIIQTTFSTENIKIEEKEGIREVVFEQIGKEPLRAKNNKMRVYSQKISDYL